MPPTNSPPETDLLENPILNSPYEAPTRHWKFDNNGITREISEGRRRSHYFLPIPATRRQQMTQEKLDFNEQTSNRLKETKLVNDIRIDLDKWRTEGYSNITHTTRTLLEHWKRSEREPRIFFCQFEAIETAIYLTEVAPKTGRGISFLNQLKEESKIYNPDLERIAHKMATGSGKTVLMAMLICWHTLNKIANPQDARFTKHFLVCTPGITIRDRLRVLDPAEEINYYKKFDLIPPGYESQITQANVVITNFHSFQRRSKVELSKVSKEILDSEASGIFQESPGEMVNRVCSSLSRAAKKSGVLIINDEAHHCYKHHSSLNGDPPPPEEKQPN